MPPILLNKNSALGFVLVFLVSKQTDFGLDIVFTVGEKRLDFYNYCGVFVFVSSGLN